MGGNYAFLFGWALFFGLVVLACLTILWFSYPPGPSPQRTVTGAQAIVLVLLGGVAAIVFAAKQSQSVYDGAAAADLQLVGGISLTVASSWALFMSGYYPSQKTRKAIATKAQHDADRAENERQKHVQALAYEASLQRALAVEAQQQAEREKQEALRKAQKRDENRQLRQWAEEQLLTEKGLSPAQRGQREPIPQAVKTFVWQRDRGQCVMCGSQERLEFDHTIPVVMGGSNTARNIQLLCERCNRSKGGHL